MRSNITQYELVAPKSLDAILQILADSPDRYTPIAGGTELMVALGAGRLQPKKLISLWNLEELRFIEVAPDAVHIGAAATFTDLRSHPVITSELSLLSQAASWTGSIANQNRGTLGGNIVNASPAADSPPALLAYDAAVTVVSTRGSRTIPYRNFHLSYKKTALAPDELLYSITLSRNLIGYKTYIRKVGTRNAQAISKVAIAAIARTSHGVIEGIRIGAASLRETPARLIATERSLLNQPVTPATIAAARSALLSETLPIDDIRSTAKYRAAVAANLLEEFLHTL
ncbi:FAD binding domain-containing protein [Tunturiibacter empetritectus]|uniref:CO/xanthine dehydrogenase FAD-binding subunit n=1 Tax=Tunturiibacter lichenicola TaxID=2051959 RepID=A0A852VD24_9BACT|nr:FAD binding domain-containing protein [Edaphobacter lichenicola]NYF88769.1 CO/xanthine dehydrogenase FAD-binding subunit [Edaphobacter lichenicola]